MVVYKKGENLMWQKLRLLVLILCGSCIDFPELINNTTTTNEEFLASQYLIGFLEGHPGSWVYGGTEIRNIEIEKNGGMLNFKIVKLKNQKYFYLDKNMQVSIWTSRTESEAAKKSKLGVEKRKPAYDVGSGVRIDILEAVHTFFGSHDTAPDSFYIFVVVSLSTPQSIGSLSNLQTSPNTRIFPIRVTITN